MKRTVLMLLAVFILFGINSILSAGESGRIVGTVYDEDTGEPVPDASITIPGTNLGTYSGSDGYFEITNLSTGIYNIEVAVIGYENAVKKDINSATENKSDVHLKKSEIQMEPVVVTATRTNHLQSKVTVFSEILDQEMLSHLSGETVGELMHSVNGTYVMDNGGLAGIQSISIRGSGTDQVLVLLDGQRLNTGQGGGVDLTNIAVTKIEQIEVIKGGHSALFGSDAIGGAINIITRGKSAAGDYNTSLRSSIGSFGFEKYNLQTHRQAGKFNFYFNYNKLLNAGNFSYSQPVTGEIVKRENNNFNSESFQISSKFDLNAFHKFNVLYQSSESQRGLSGLISFPSPRASRNEWRKIFSIMGENRFGRRLLLKEQYSFHQFNNEYSDPGSWVPANDTHKSTISQVNLQSTLQLHSNLNLTNGFEYRNEQLNSSKFTDSKRELYAAYAQSELELSLLNEMEMRLIPALRWDNYSNFKEQYSPKLGLLVQGKGLTRLGLRANYGKSFRIPSFNDLFWPDDGWTRGNQHLLPEESINLDIGIFYKQFSARDLQIELTYFNNRITNLIMWAPGNSLNDFGAAIWEPQNIGKAGISGLESSAKFSIVPGLFHLKIGHTYLKALDKTNSGSSKERYLFYRPKHKFNLLGNVNFEMLYFTFNYRNVGNRFTNSANSKSLPAYKIVDLVLGSTFQLNYFGLESKLEALNIADKTVFIIDGYPTPGREFRASLGINF